MFIIKNSLISIMRNKSRNILIGIIIVVIACSTTMTLAIRNTADKLVTQYENSHDLIATISFNRDKLQENFKGGSDAQKGNIEAFNKIDSISLADVKKYGESDYLKGFYYTYTTSLNSDTLSKASDSYEYETEKKETTTSSSTKTERQGENRPGTPPGGFSEKQTINNFTTTIITREKELLNSARNLTGDFKLEGYSSYDAMTSFVEGTFKVVDGEMISDFDKYQCIISQDLATLNKISVNDKIKLKNPNTNKVYSFTVTGIYEDSQDDSDSHNMYSSIANTIITSSDIVEKLVKADSDLVANVTPSFLLNSEKDIESFSNEVKEKGLSDYYEVNTNQDELTNATRTIDNVKTFATTFLMITLVIGAVVLFVINMINIRERKYEIGVLRTIGMSKTQLSLQFLSEILIVTLIALVIGAGIGAVSAKPVGNMLLQNEINSINEENKSMAQNFGKGPGMKLDQMKTMNEFESIDAVVDFTVIMELLGIGLLLSAVSSTSSMISIQRFSPLTILKERS